MRASILVVLAVICLGGVAHAQWSGREVMEDGELLVKNPEQALDVVEVEIEELWERGAEDDDEVMFGRLAQLVQDADGNLYVQDWNIAGRIMKLVRVKQP